MLNGKLERSFFEICMGMKAKIRNKEPYVEHSMGLLRSSCTIFALLFPTFLEKAFLVKISSDIFRCWLLTLLQTLPESNDPIKNRRWDRVFLFIFRFSFHLFLNLFNEFVFNLFYFQQQLLFLRATIQLRTVDETGCFILILYFNFIYF